ncbi:MAG: RNA methyltransferase [Flavobacteriales bacterium]|nr:RNA methyltransferase [Flavobacteriales bacterium]
MKIYKGMITNKQIKLINSLSRKKERILEQMFVIEGDKMIDELIRTNLEIIHIFGLDQKFQEHPKFESISAKDIERISSYKSSSEAIAIVKLPEQNAIQNDEPSIILEDINDPGNLGTIIRTAEWFGIKQIICSPNSVDCYNPKVLSATKGSILRVNVIYTDLKDFIKSSFLPVYAARLEGQDMRQLALTENAHLLFGNESHGISHDLALISSESIRIPDFGEATESLNLGISVAVVLSFLKIKA